MHFNNLSISFYLNGKFQLIDTVILSLTHGSTESQVPGSVSVYSSNNADAVESFGLLPTNHFGARKKRSAEQALLLLQEHIYNAWRSKKVLSLVSFDVEGAYNKAYKDRLLQRFAARGVPPALVR